MHDVIWTIWQHHMPNVSQGWTAQAGAAPQRYIIFITTRQQRLKNFDFKPVGCWQFEFHGCLQQKYLPGWCGVSFYSLFMLPCSSMAVAIFWFLKSVNHTPQLSVHWFDCWRRNGNISNISVRSFEPWSLYFVDNLLNCCTRSNNFLSLHLMDDLLNSEH